MQLIIAGSAVLALLLVGAVVVLLLRAGGDAQPTGTPTPAPQATATATPSPMPSPTTATPSPAPPPQAACPEVSVPGGAGDLVELPASGDFDGDGAADVLRSFLAGGDWRLQVELAAGGGAELVVQPQGPSEVAALGGAAVDEGGPDEIWAKLGTGAYAEILGLYVLDGCALEPVMLAGTTATFAVGASVGAGSGLDCDAPAAPPGADLTVYVGEGVDGTEYLVTANYYRLQGGTLNLVRAVDGSDDGSLFTFRCGSLGL